MSQVLAMLEPWAEISERLRRIQQKSQTEALPRAETVADVSNLEDELHS